MEGWTLASRSPTGLKPGLDTSHQTPAKVRQQLLGSVRAFPKGHPEPANHSTQQRSEIGIKGVLSTKRTVYWTRRV